MFDDEVAEKWIVAGEDTGWRYRWANDQKDLMFIGAMNNDKIEPVCVASVFVDLDENDDVVIADHSANLNASQFRIMPAGEDLIELGSLLCELSMDLKVEDYL